MATRHLIVDGSDGGRRALDRADSRVRHTVLGSVSEACVRQASCPVVVVAMPAPEHAGTAPVPRT